MVSNVLLPTMSSMAFPPAIVPPKAILSIAGIHDFVHLRDCHSPVYQSFISSALGTSDERVWKEASPSTGDYNRTWPDGARIVLAWSQEDGLVDYGQVEVMAAWLATEQGGRWRRQDDEPLERQGQEKHARQLIVLEVDGEHDMIWKEGRELARAIRSALPLRPR